MPKPYSQDLRDRVIDAVERGEMSRRAAARRYEISESVAISGMAIPFARHQVPPAIIRLAVCLLSSLFISVIGKRGATAAFSRARL